MANLEIASPPLSLGFIGGSLQSAIGRTHLCASTMDNRWAIAAGCFSRDAALNHETGSSCGVARERNYDDWRDLILCEKEKLDAVVVLTPIPEHYEMVMGCLEAKLPVICEKALTTSSERARQIRDVVQRNKGFLAITYNYSGYPMVRELRQLVRNGALGKIIHFQIEMPQEGFLRVDKTGNRPTPQPWRLHDGNVPTIALDLAIHLHHLLFYITGESPTEVVAHQGTHGWFPDVVDNVDCLCHCTNGLYGHVWYSKSALGHRNGLRLRIYGSEASAEWFQGYPEELVVMHANGNKNIVDRAATVDVACAARYGRFKAGHPAGFLEAFANLYVDIADSLHCYRMTGAVRSCETFGADLAIDGLCLLEAIRDSVATRAWKTVAKERHANGQHG